MTLPFENNTAKCTNRLAWRSILANKVRSAVTVFAIAVTAMLFTSVATLAVGTLQSTTLSMQLMKGSRSDGGFLYMNEAQFEALKECSFAERVGLRMPIGFLSNAKKHSVELDLLDKTQMEMNFVLPTHGRAPETPEELVASDRALRALGVEPKVGAEVTIEFTAHGRSYSLPMKVSGWYESIWKDLSVMAVGPGFKDAHPEIFEYTYPEDREMAGTYYPEIYADSAIGLGQKMKDFAASAGSLDIGADDYIGVTVNTMTNPVQSISTVLAAAGAILLFVFCGYLLIFNIFDIAVTQDIRRYGLYRTIGMSKRQMKRTLNRQAAALSLIGIPVGLVLGFVIGKAALPAVMSTFSVDLRQFYSVKVSVDPRIFLVGALFAAFTVFLSTRKPVRTISAVSPIEAFRYVERGAGKRKTKKRLGKVSVMRMAWENIGRNRRRTAFIAVSLMLCVVMLNSARNMAESVDMDKYMEEFVRTDYSVATASALNRLEGYKYAENGMNAEAAREILAQPWVKNGSVTYKNTLNDHEVTFDWGVSPERIDDASRLETPDVYTGYLDSYIFRLGADRYPICNTAGMNKDGIARLRLPEGTDLDALWEKLQKGEGLILGRSKEMGKDQPYEGGYDSGLEIGDVVTVRVDGVPAFELPVLAEALFISADMDVADNIGISEVGVDGPAFFLSDRTFQDIFDAPSILRVEFNVEEGDREAAEAFLKAYTEEHGELMYTTADQYRENAKALRNMYLLVGGLLALIFGAAGLLNMVNVLISSILTRRLEFATLQSIGMTAKQLRRMVMLESFDYVALASVLGVAASVAVNGTILKSFGSSGNGWYMTLRPSVLAALAACGVMILFALAAAPVLLKIFQKGSVVERLREKE